MSWWKQLLFGVSLVAVWTPSLCATMTLKLLHIEGFPRLPISSTKKPLAFPSLQSHLPASDLLLPQLHRLGQRQFS